ncbi:BCN_G0006890.mRNA.1.CDS.1 [Saccharomyces cerevisiae]|nr:BCN_G0006890.mRNA.1.CDS.1 [Saccharomyces cerevisiae]CAI7059266.1 BCN_G0006890.mRNA.1.CDS.1 [Saccharomyces cerevisiae]
MACMVIFASIGVKCLYPHGQDGPSSKGAGNAMIVFTCFYIFCFATTWAPVAYIVVAESFPSKVKSKAMSISTAFNWLWQFLIETIGLSLEEIRLLYEEGIKPWKSASWVPPSRREASSRETEVKKKSWKEVLKFPKSSN